MLEPMHEARLMEDGMRNIMDIVKVKGNKLDKQLWRV
jgi:hypothetical protein